VIAGLLAGVAASDDEETEMLEYAKERRTLSKDARSGAQPGGSRSPAGQRCAPHTRGRNAERQREELLDKLIEMLWLLEEGR
jgi:hypothetical protein